MDGIIRNTAVPRKLNPDELDFYSEGAGINVEGSERNRNWLGATISLSTYVLIVLATYYYLTKFLDETNPKIQFNVKTEPVSNRFNLEQVELYPFLLISNPAASKNLKYSEEDPTFSDETDQGVDTTEGERRVLQSAGVNTYLDFTNYGYYFNMSLDYRLIQYKQTQTGDIVESTTIGKRTLIPCSDAAWVKNPKYQDYLNKSPFALGLIKRYGICMDIGSNTIISGDGMTKESARLYFSLSLCNDTSPLCPEPNASWNQIANAGDLGVIIGTFEPFINNEQKKDPWNYAINTDNRIPIDALVSASASVYIKKLEAQTDFGRIIEDTKTESKAAVKNIRMDFASKLNLGTEQASQEYTMLISQNDNFLDISFVASRTTEVFSRSYDTVLDLFGNIGGAIDFILILFTLCFNWYENLSSTLTMRRALVRRFNLPKRYEQPSSVFGLCNCRRKRDKFDGETLDSMGESALNFERMAEDAAITSFTQRVGLPAEIRALLPTVLFIENKMKIMDEAEEEKREKEKAKEKGKEKDGGKAVSPMETAQMLGADGENSGMLKSAKKPEDENTLKSAFNLISIPSEDQHKPIRQEMLKIINEYCKRQNISNPEDLFEDPTPSQSKSGKASIKYLFSSPKDEYPESPTPITPALVPAEGIELPNYPSQLDNPYKKDEN